MDKQTLGDEFANFVQVDQRVHRIAAELAKQATGSVPASQLFDQYILIQEGCISCHTQFRSCLSEALADTPVIE